MKKLLLSLAILTQLGVTYAQDRAFQSSAFIGGKNTLGRSEVKISAMRNFKKQFPDVEEKWSTKEDGFRARFSKGGISYMIDYNHKGYWVNTIRVYDEKDLDREIRKMVKSNYIDYSIVKVIEVQIGKSLVHIVKLENESSLLTLHIANGEVSEMENYRK
jgi:hypothetical protein